MWTLSGFADEISPDFVAQCRHLRSLGMRYLEFRSAWNTNVLDLSNQQLDEVRRTIESHELRVSCIGSPVGKTSVDHDFGFVIDQMRIASRIARLLDTQYVRIFSFYVPPGVEATACRDEVMRRMTALAGIARDNGLILLHENEAGIFGDIPGRCLDLVATVDSPNLRLTWDPANFVQAGVAPFDDGYGALRPYLAYMQIKDALASDGSVVAAGRGDGQVVETIRALREDGYDGFFSLEPHLSIATRSGGFSGPVLFTEAWRAFTTLVRSEGIEIA